MHARRQALTDEHWQACTHASRLARKHARTYNKNTRTPTHARTEAKTHVLFSNAGAHGRMQPRMNERTQTSKRGRPLDHSFDTKNSVM